MGASANRNNFLPMPRCTGKTTPFTTFQKSSAARACLRKFARIFSWAVPIRSAQRSTQAVGAAGAAFLRRLGSRRVAAKIFELRSHEDHEETAKTPKTGSRISSNGRPQFAIANRQFSIVNSGRIEMRPLCVLPLCVLRDATPLRSAPPCVGWPAGRRACREWGICCATQVAPAVGNRASSAEDLSPTTC